MSEYPGPSQAIYYFVVMVSPRFASFSEIVQVRNPEKEAGEQAGKRRGKSEAGYRRGRLRNARFWRFGPRDQSRVVPPGRVSVAAQAETPQPQPRTRLRGGEVWGLLCLLFMHPTLAGNCEAGNGKVSSLPQVAAGKRSDGSRLILTAEPSRGPAAAQRDFRAAVSGISGSSIAVLTVNRWGTCRAVPDRARAWRRPQLQQGPDPEETRTRTALGRGRRCPGNFPRRGEGFCSSAGPGAIPTRPTGPWAANRAAPSCG